MTERLLEMEDASASSDVVQCERVPECVQASLRRIETEFATELFDIAENVPATEFRSVPRHKDENVFRCDLLPAEEVAPEFDRERNNPVFAAFAVQGDKEIVEIDIAPLEAQDFVDGNPVSASVMTSV